MKKKSTMMCWITCVCVGLQASAASYSVVTHTIDAGGAAASSGNYSHQGSLGGITGVSTVAAPVEIAKAGYIGQLYEVAGLQLAAAPTNVNEGATTQLSAAQLLDDDTTLAVASAAVNWSVAGGPLAFIDANGEGTAEIVYENTAATAQGIYKGNTSQIGLIVLNVNLDDYGSYAGDGLDDDWQYLYFGLDNPDAGPLLDPDHDLQNNKFEFVAGLIPTNYTSRFLLAIEPGGTSQQNIVFSPRYGDRTYTVLYTTNLFTASWGPLASFGLSDASTVRTVTDLLATDDKRFYHVKITKP
jgi:hypothetical protein